MGFRAELRAIWSQRVHVEQYLRLSPLTCLLFSPERGGGRSVGFPRLSLLRFLRAPFASMGAVRGMKDTKQVLARMGRLESGLLKQSFVPALTLGVSPGFECERRNFPLPLRNHLASIPPRPGAVLRADLCCRSSPYWNGHLLLFK